MPIPVVVQGEVTIVGKTISTPFFTIPGLHSGSAYASGDAMGTKFMVPAPTSGILHTVNVLDQDKEQLQFDIVLFASDFTQTADDAAFDMADDDGLKFLGKVTITNADYVGFNDNAVATVPNIGLLFQAPQGFIWGQCVTRGAPNLTAVTDLRIRLLFLSD